MSTGYFKAIRNPEALELIAANHNAFVLLYVIAHRACRQTGFNRHNLERGQAFIGDYVRYSLTEQEYRTAKLILEKGNFATFKSTNKGTIATLTDTRVFDVNLADDNGQDNGCPTDAQRTGNGQATTNKEVQEEKKSKGVVVELPENLRTPRLISKWGDWQEFRKGLKKCKDFGSLFREQSEWLAGFDEATAFEILSASIRNGWQGLFEPKGSAKATASSQPARPATATANRIGLESQAKLLREKLKTLQDQTYYEHERTPEKMSELKSWKEKLAAVEKQILAL